MPSRREGYGVVAREAMASGRAVVATRVGGLADAIEDGVTGVLVEPRDPATLRSKLVSLLANRELRDRLGRAARSQAQQAFNWEEATDRYRTAYHDATDTDEHREKRGRHPDGSAGASRSLG